MRAPRIPDDDRARIAALEALGLLDTGPDERFDRITRTAATLLGTPIALINLVDGTRQWSKSAVGMPQGGEGTRDISFCAHVVGDDAPLWVDDTLDDDRFSDNPQVTEDPPALRAYHGVPVRGITGHVLGSLCVADTEPRRLTPLQREVLADLAGWVEAEFDRTELSRMTARELHARQRLEAVTDGVGEGIVVLDRHGTVQLANPVARDLLGPATPIVPGAQIVDLLATAGAPTRAIEDLLERDGALAAPLRLRLDLGPDDRVLEVTITSLAAERAHVAVVRDVSEQRAVERLKDEFTSTVSHELRTPLTSIKGTLGLVTGGVVGELPPEAASLLEVAGRNTERLIRLVNDILDLDRLTSGRVELDPRETDVARLLGAAADAVHGVAQAARVQLVVTPVDAHVTVDVDRTVQILTNLLGNAIRFSPPGGEVRLSASRSGGGISFAVADQGRGIPGDHLDRIFDRFAQVDASDARERSGTGLGLPIARGLAERQGGHLRVDSALGVGSTFTLWLPLVVEPSSAPSI